MMDQLIATKCNNSLKACAKGFAGSATEASTPQVRQAFMQMSQKAIQMQEELSKMMEQKGWYTPVPAHQEDVQKVLPELKNLTQTPAMV